MKLIGMRAALILSICLMVNMMLAQPVQVKDIAFNGMVFKCRVAGDPKGEPVILLHGWPETSHMWTTMMEKLSAEGYYCIAPDQRGFSPNARPKKVKYYGMDYLVADIIALADTMGFSKFHLIGHDWGSAIGWAIVADHADRIKSWSALSVPHVKAFSTAIRFNEEQAEKSKYMKLFQLRGLPEWVLLRKDLALLRDAWKESSAEEIEDYVAVLGNKKALKASLAYYRANYKTLKKGQGIDRYGDVKIPTLYIWGNDDMAVTRFAAEGTAQYMQGSYHFVELEAGHWLMQEAFKGCYNPIIKHLAQFK